MAIFNLSRLLEMGLPLQPAGLDGSLRLVRRLLQKFFFDGRGCQLFDGLEFVDLIPQLSE